MPTPAPEDFWKLLAASRLVADDAVGRLRRALAEEPAAGAEAGDEAATMAVAKWLVARGVITKWQARRLLNGESGPFFVGDYRLLERLESDGPGRVFRGRHEPSGKAVCLVLLDRRLCQRVDVWTEIVRRATIANEATDPTLSRTWALEQVQGNRFIVCEDVPGESLADELARLGPLPPAEACRTLLPVFTAVAELHRRGAVHGGLSLDGLKREPAPPGTGERGGRLRLLQFPLAGDPHAVPGQTPVEATERIARLGRRASFVPPELLLPGRFCDERGDVYALGCMLHSLLTGALPCWQGDAQRTLSHAAFVGPAPLGPPQVPVELATLVSYLVAREPDNRYADAAQAADALATSLGLPPVSATLPPPQRPAATAAAAVPVAASAAAVAAPAPESLVVALPSASRSQDAARRRAARLRLVGAAVAAGLVALVLGVFFAPRDDAPPADEASNAGEQDAREPREQGDEETARPSESRPSKAATAADARGEAHVPGEDQEGRDAAPPAARRRPTGPQLTVVDSPSLPWAAPTSGRPPTLDYLPPGAQIVLLARPAEIVADEEGQRFVKSLGPRVAAAVAAVEKACGCGLDGIESLQVGWQAGEGGAGMISGWVATLREASPLATDADARERAWGTTEEVPFEVAGAGETLHVGPQIAHWLPADREGRVLLVAGRRVLEGMAQVKAPTDVDDAGLQAASLPQDLATLVGMLDASRHLTVFGSPYALRADARESLSGPVVALVDPLAAFVGDGVQAAALSLHFGPSLYAEVDVVAARAEPAQALAPRLSRRIDGLADAVEEFCAALELHPYGKKLVMRLPAMIRVVAAQARAGAEGKGVVLNAYLPRHAGHNIVLAGELALEQAGSGGATGARVAVTGPPTAAGGGDPLQKKISLVFAKDTLEKSIQMLADEIGVPMEIRGSDLQLEGITKNQSFGLEERDRPAVAVLKTILAKADPAGRLVYVIRSQDGGVAIDVTTRAAAEKRGDKLPPGFEAGGGGAGEK